MINSQSIQKIHHVELYVGNIVHSIHFYKYAFGFVEIDAQDTSKCEIVSAILCKNNVVMVLKSAKNIDNIVAKQVALHGDFVKDISLRVEDVESTYNQAIKSGFVGVKKPYIMEIDGMGIKQAVISAFGSTNHTLIEYKGDDFILTEFPEFRHTAQSDSSLQDIDHVAIAIADMYKYKDLYEQGLGFYQSYQETITTQKTGMDSIVMNSQNDLVKFVFVMPKQVQNKSQIEKFLDSHGTDGVQHLAFSTNNILDDINMLKQMGINFLPIPDIYYKDLTSEIKEYFGDKMEVIKRLQILVDKDEDGYLLQVFTKSLHTKPTFFIEIIQRNGASGFGRNNILALFKAVEKQIA